MKADEGKLSPILVGVAGEYFVAGELSRRGVIAAITLRNSRGIDIVTRCKEEHQEWLKGRKRDGTARKDTDIRLFKPHEDENFQVRWDDIDV